MSKNGVQTLDEKLIAFLKVYILNIFGGYRAT